MADQNKSNKGSMNSADGIDDSSTLTEMERIGARNSRKSVNRSRLDDQARQGETLLKNYMKEGRAGGYNNTPVYQQHVAGQRAELKEIRGKMNSMDSAASTRAESEASTYISRQFSQPAINSQVNAMQIESTVQNRAFTMQGNSHDKLNTRTDEIMGGVRYRERTAQNEVKGMFSNGEVNSHKSSIVNQMIGGTKEDLTELAAIKAAKVFQKASGNDPHSQMKNLGMMGQKAKEILTAQELGQEIKSGGVNISQNGKIGTVKNADVDKEVVNQASLLSKALKELTDGVDKTDKELAVLRSTADESATNLKKLQEAAKAGAGSGGMSGMQKLSLAATGFTMAAGASQELLVNQRMTQVSNIGGFANLANQQYDQYQKARGGDIASQIALSQTGESDKFGMEMKRGTNISQAMYIAGGTAQAAAGGAQILEASAQKANAISYATGNSTANSQALMSGITTTAQGVATAGVTLADTQRGEGLSAQQARLSGINAQQQARAAVNAIGASQMQGLRNMYTNMDVVGQNMGSKAGTFMTDATSEGNLGRMVNAKLSPEQYSHLAGAATAQMGSTFDKEQIYAARNLEKAGYGSAEQNIQRMGSLAGAGANNPQAGLESVLSAAMTKGLDSSKALNMMVENTAALVSTSAGAAVGIDTTNASSSLLAANVNGNMENKEFALQQAKNAVDRTNQATTNRDVSFTGMANTAGLQMALEKKGINIGGDAAIALQGVTDIATLKSLQNDPKKAAEFFKDKGINVAPGKENLAVNTILREKQIQNVRDASLQAGLNAEDVVDDMNKGTLSAEKKAKLAVGAINTGRTGYGELERSNNGITGGNVDPTTGKTISDGKGPANAKTQGDDLRKSGDMQMAEAALTAAKNLKEFGGALQVFTELTKKFEKDGLKNEKEFTGSAGKFASEFKTSTGMFQTSVGTFDKAVKILADKAGLSSNGNPVKPETLNERK